MKDMVSIQDYLVTPSEVGDWEGEEELVADRLNELLHYAWDRVEEDLPVAEIDSFINGIWDHLRGSTALLDVDFDELLDWLDSYINGLDDVRNQMD